MGSTDDDDRRESRGAGAAAGGGWILDWRSLVGLLAIIGGLWTGSRLLVTQDQLARTEDRVMGKIERDRAELEREIDQVFTINQALIDAHKENHP